MGRSEAPIHALTYKGVLRDAHFVDDVHGGGYFCEASLRQRPGYRIGIPVDFVQLTHMFPMQYSSLRAVLCMLWRFWKQLKQSVVSSLAKVIFALSNAEKRAFQSDDGCLPFQSFGLTLRISILKHIQSPFPRQQNHL
eukprot:4998520-Pleurochrysis_carterae.AAC.1